MDNNLSFDDVQINNKKKQFDDVIKKHTYKKRSGTSGVTGQLYETKLLSLILFRALEDDEITDFYLGTNLNDIGVFDDICFKFKIENKNVAAFIQAKHRDDPRKGGITDYDFENIKSDFSLQKSFDSYLKIQQKFAKSNYDTDKMFTGIFETTELHFIIYTPATAHKITKKTTSHLNKKNMLKIRDLISSNDGDSIFQINYNDSDVYSLLSNVIEEQLRLIVNALLECTSSRIGPSQESIEILSKHQLFLIPDVLQITLDDTDECTKAVINPRFFYSNNFLMISLRELIFDAILNNSIEFNEDEAMGVLLALIGNITYVRNIPDIAKIIGNILVVDKLSNKLKMADTAPEVFQSYRKKINDIQLSPTIIREAHFEAGKKKLESLIFVFPQKNCKLWDNNTLIGQTGKKIFYEEQNNAIRFLENLYFYTEEGKQDRVEKILKNELFKCAASNDQLFRMHSDAIFLKLHDKVQKWSMLQGNAYYLTKRCGFVEKSRKEIVEYPYLTILNYNFRNQLQKYNIKYKSKIIADILSLITNMSSKILNIVTDNKMLTCIKLQQCFTEDKYLLLDFKSINNLSSAEVTQKFEEIMEYINTLVFIFNELVEDNDCDTLMAIINANNSNRIILVTEENMSNKLKCYDINVIVDKGTSLAELSQETQDLLLAYNKVTVQGETVSLERILVNSERKDLLITGEILQHILNNENVVIGKPLADEKYANMKDYYIQRYLCNDNYFENSLKINNIFDIVDPVVVITAEPGMGKSTLLTHISVETKKNNPNCWIVRVNLLDHCSQFLKWQKERKVIDLIDTMTLICKSELQHYIVSDNFELEEAEGVLRIKSCKFKGFALLHLELLIRSYNTSTIIFIYDGFDEICPHYKKEVLKFIQNVMPSSKNVEQYSKDFNIVYKNFYGLNTFFRKCYKTPKKDKPSYIIRVWIASRPYNSIIETLEHEFGTPFQLKPLSTRDQNIFYQKFLGIYIKLQDLNNDQFKNIEGFFKYMSQFRRCNGQEHKVLFSTSIPLNNMYEVAVDHFKNNILYTHINVDKEKLRSEWVSSKELLTFFERCSGSLNEIESATQLSGIPLHMFVAGNYFVNEIKDTVQKDIFKKWDLNVNTFEYYKKFLETKFKTIRLEEKNRRYTDCPDERLAYEKDKKEFIDNHKVLAFFAIFHHDKYYLRQVISKAELSKVKEMIKKIRRGEEKTGLIHRIENNIPMFVHLVFAEYFAIEYITDILKIVKKDRKHRVIGFIVNHLLLKKEKGLITILNHKLKFDAELKHCLSDHESKNTVFELLLEQDDMIDLFYGFYGEPEEVKIVPALNKVVSIGATEVTMFLLNSIEGNLNEENFGRFVNLIKDTFFVGAAFINEENIISFVLDKFRSLDAATVNDVLMKSKLHHFVSATGTIKSNEDILYLLKSHVNKLIAPHWYYDEHHQLQSVYLDDYSL